MQWEHGHVSSICLINLTRLIWCGCRWVVRHAVCVLQDVLQRRKLAQTTELSRSSTRQILDQTADGKHDPRGAEEGDPHKLNPYYPLSPFSEWWPDWRTLLNRGGEVKPKCVFVGSYQQVSSADGGVRPSPGHFLSVDRRAILWGGHKQPSALWGQPAAEVWGQSHTAGGESSVSEVRCIQLLYIPSLYNFSV